MKSSPFVFTNRLMMTTAMSSLLLLSCGTSPKVDEVEERITNDYAIPPLDIDDEKQKTADWFSWRTFIALCWPADTATCGPDTTNGSSILGGSGPLVWETYLTSDEVFVASPSMPETWCAQGMNTKRFASLPPKIQELARQTGVYRFIYRSSKSPHSLEEAVGGPLVDQNGRFVRYEVRMNQDEYNYIITHSLWNQKGQQAFVADSTIDMPAGPTSYGPYGSMEFKAAWKIMGEGDDPSRFYTIQAIVYNDDQEDPSPGPNPVTLGLVGLHIARKTATQPNWVWSTFEQVDNLTKSFYNPACDTCPVNQSIDTPYVELAANGTPLNPPTQVKRINPVDDTFADTLNQQFQKMLAGSVWAHYKLISTQWLLFENMFPAFLANTVQETYVQGPNPPSYGGFHLQPDQPYYRDSLYNPFAPGISASCMACHFVANIPNTTASADFSFMLGEAQ